MDFQFTMVQARAASAAGLSSKCALVRESDGNSPFGMKRSFLAAPRGGIISTTPISTHMYRGFWEHDLWKNPTWPVRDNKAAAISVTRSLQAFEPGRRSPSAGKRRLPTFRLQARAKGPGQAVSKQRAPVQQPCTKEGVLGAKRGRRSSGETAKGVVLLLRKSGQLSGPNMSMHDDADDDRRCSSIFSRTPRGGSQEGYHYGLLQ